MQLEKEFETRRKNGWQLWREKFEDGRSEIKCTKQCDSREQVDGRAKYSLLLG